MQEVKHNRFKLGGLVLGVHSWVVYLFLYLPIIILIIFSFNAARINAVWTGFTFGWYREVLRNSAMLNSLKNSVIVAIASTLISTAIGTITAFAINRFDFPGKRVFDSVLYMPIIIPDIVMGISLAIFYNIIRFTFSLLPIIVAHVAFNISFVAVVVLKLFQLSVRPLPWDWAAIRSLQARIKLRSFPASYTFTTGRTM